LPNPTTDSLETPTRTISPV